MASRNQEPEYDVGVHHVKLLFPKAYLSHADFVEGDRTLTIADVRLRDLKTERGTDRKPVVKFEEYERLPQHERKVLVLNQTNAGIIAEIHDQPDPTKWKGLRVTLYATTCEAFGKEVDCIRVRAKKPQEDKPRNVEPLLEESLRGELKKAMQARSVQAQSLGDVRTWLHGLPQDQYDAVADEVLPPIRNDEEAI